MPIINLTNRFCGGQVVTNQTVRLDVIFTIFFLLACKLFLTFVFFSTRDQFSYDLCISLNLDIDTVQLRASK